MSTPRKNFNYTSPYAKPVQQYPSQSEEYISFGVGGQFQSGNDRSSGRLHYPNGSNKQRRGNSHFLSTAESYSPNNSYSTQKKWSTPAKQGGQFRNRYQNKDKQEPAAISSYLHPSMTEDPWKEFMHRIEAISKSKISLKSGSDSNETEGEGVV